jgi:hypothetical protein
MRLGRQPLAVRRISSVNKPGGRFIFLTASLLNEGRETHQVCKPEEKIHGGLRIDTGDQGRNKAERTGQCLTL